jgi:hypothetical protein
MDNNFLDSFCCNFFIDKELKDTLGTRQSCPTFVTASFKIINWAASRPFFQKKGDEDCREIRDLIL